MTTNGPGSRLEYPNAQATQEDDQQLWQQMEEESQQQDEGE